MSSEMIGNLFLTVKRQFAKKKSMFRNLTSIYGSKITWALIPLSLSWRRPLSYRNNDLHHKRVKHVNMEVKTLFINEMARFQ